MCTPTGERWGDAAWHVWRAATDIGSAGEMNKMPLSGGDDVSDEIFDLVLRTPSSFGGLYLSMGPLTVGRDGNRG